MRLKQPGLRHCPRLAPRFKIGFFFCAFAMLFAMPQPAAAQKATASLTIQGVMPATQRMSLSTPSVAVTDGVGVLINARENIGARYSLTLERKTTPSRLAPAPASYKIRFNRRSFTLASETVNLISTGNRGSADGMLEISPNDVARNDFLLLTLISQ